MCMLLRACVRVCARARCTRAWFMRIALERRDETASIFDCSRRKLMYCVFIRIAFCAERAGADDARARG